MKKYLSGRSRRRAKIRAKIKGVAQRPRLSVFRSNQHVYAQIIDDEKQATLAAMNDLIWQKQQKKSLKKSKSVTKTKVAYQVGLALAKQVQQQKISKVVFDRGGYRYHGRIKALAEGAREGGLSF